ncbi:MAG: C25 family cysteine peptidase, partial [Chloroflexota bacterium]
VGGVSAAWFGYQLMQPSSQVSSPAPDQTINLATTQTGFYALSTRDLGISDWSAQAVALTDQGEAVPYLLDGPQLIFFAFAQTSKYSSKRVYQLHLGQHAEGKEMGFARFDGLPNAGSPSHATVNRLIRLEENHRYVSTARQDEESSTWFWERIHVSGLFETEVIFHHVGDGSATVTADLFGVSHDIKVDLDHDLDFMVNGKNLGQIVWDGNHHFSTDLELPPQSLQSGSNLIQLDNRPEGAAFVDISELDSLEFRYNSVPILVDGQIHFKTAAGAVELSGFSGQPYIIAFDSQNQALLADIATAKWGRITVDFPTSATVYASDPFGLQKPEILNKISSNSLQRSHLQTDLLIITNQELSASLQTFKAAREAQGLSVSIATVETIYDQYGFGQPSPFAIQTFLKDAAENWPKPAPTYLLLVGGTTYDYKNYLSSERENKVPSMLIEVSHSGETVSDTRLADIDQDGRADFAVGRWPVNSTAELEAVIQRTLAYEKNIPGDQILATADQTAAEFSSTSDRLLQTTGLESQNLNRIYNADTSTITNAWNEGNWLVTYVGHGSLDLWGSDGLIRGNMVENLQNPLGIAQPIVLQFTCLTGYFAHPEESSLSEKMLLQENGPVLIVSATSLTYSSSQEPFARGMLHGLQDPALSRIGDVLYQAQAGLDISNPAVREVYDTFTLFGDPSAKIARPAAAVSK